MTVLFEVFPGCYSIAHTFWPVSWEALLSHNIYRPLDIPSQTALSKQGNYKEAFHSWCSWEQAEPLSERTPSERWQSRQSCKSAVKSWRAYDNTGKRAERSSFIRARLPSGKGALYQLSGKGSLMKCYSNHLGDCSLSHIPQKEEDYRNTLRAAQLKPK